MKWINKQAAHLRQGERAEQWACDYLLQQGLALITKNYRCKAGEIDLVMKHQNSLVFIEVRYRKNQQFGGALASVTTAKQHKLRLTAEHYLQHKAVKSYSRFDVIAISGEQTPPLINWIQNAF